jgi:uncharacterized protein YdaU (DUF1376 family)
MAYDRKVDIWMPLYVSDFLTATLGWSAEERGHYLTLLMAQWAMGGLPEDPKALERISPGVGECWAMIGEKFAREKDGKLRNARLEEHRAKSLDLREERSKKASKAAKKRWLAGQDQCSVQSQAECPEQCHGQCSEHSVEQCSSYAASSSSSQEELHTHTHTPPAASRTGAGEPEPWRKPGWAHDEWQALAATWNVTERAAPWPHATPPNGFADLAASPGWLESARKGMAMLPACRMFDTPVPWTQFVAKLDRILAGEFREPKDQGRRGTAAAGRTPRRGNL